MDPLTLILLIVFLSHLAESGRRRRPTLEERDARRAKFLAVCLLLYLLAKLLQWWNG